MCVLQVFRKTERGEKAYGGAQAEVIGWKQKAGPWIMCMCVCFLSTHLLGSPLRLRVRSHLELGERAKRSGEDKEDEDASRVCACVCVLVVHRREAGSRRAGTATHVRYSCARHRRSWSAFVFLLRSSPYGVHRQGKHRKEREENRRTLAGRGARGVGVRLGRRWRGSRLTGAHGTRRLKRKKVRTIKSRGPGSWECGCSAL